MTPDSAVPRRGERILAVLLVLLGIVLRLFQYLGNRSLWGDEVAIALNMRTRGFLGLLHPLSYDQTMPIGLLYILKSVASVLGFSELVLRLPLLLAGCALLILTWVLFSQIFDAGTVLVTIALLAVSQPLIYYSAELKQYGFDAVVSVVLVWLGVRLLRGTSEEAWRPVILGGAIALLFSQPVAFVLASIGLGAVLDRRFLTSQRWRNCTFGAAACWLVILGLLYRLSYRATLHSAFMRMFWSDDFISVHGPNFRGTVSRVLFVVLGAPHLVHVRVSVLGGLLLVGLYAVWKKQGLSIAALLAGPLLWVLVAATLGVYPLAVRLLLFSVPVLFLIYSSALLMVSRWLPRSFSGPAFVVLACLFVGPTLAQAAAATRHFNQREATRDLVPKIESAHDGTPVYLVFGRYTQWGYYAGDWKNHAGVWKPRIDAAYECMIVAELAYFGDVRDRALNCENLDFPAVDGRPEEIVGNAPPGPNEGAQAESRWAAREALRIESARSHSVWLFLPIYSEHFIAGFPKQRRLLEKLEAQLQSDQCRLVETGSKGESLAHRYQCTVLGPGAALP